MERTMYITASFPRLGDGIGDAAGKLYAAIDDKSQIELVTSKIRAIQEYILECGYTNFELVSGWDLITVKRLINRMKQEQIKRVLIEYAGNGYRKYIGISFLPLAIRIHNVFSKEKVYCHLRLHEFSMCRPVRKLLTYPLVLFSHHIDTPSYVEYKILNNKYGDKVTKSMIGSNLKWREDKKEKFRKNEDKIVLAFFGGIYPGKGIERLINIWERLEKKYPNRYEYQLLGGFPEGLTNAFNDYQTQIQKLLSKKGLYEKVIITGFLPAEEIEERIDNVDIAVLPYEDGLTLRRGSFLAFLGRQVVVVTSEGDEEVNRLFKNAVGVRMCKNLDEMIENIEELSINEKFIEAGIDNRRFKKMFEWNAIEKKVMKTFDKK